MFYLVLSPLRWLWGKFETGKIVDWCDVKIIMSLLGLPIVSFWFHMVSQSFLSLRHLIMLIDSGTLFILCKTCMFMTLCALKILQSSWILVHSHFLYAFVLLVFLFFKVKLPYHTKASRTTHSTSGATVFCLGLDLGSWTQLNVWCLIFCKSFHASLISCPDMGITRLVLFFFDLYTDLCRELCLASDHQQFIASVDV